MTLPLNSRLSALYDTNGTQKDFGFGFRVFFDPDNGGYGLEVRRQTADGYEVIPKSDYLVLPVEDNSAGVVRFSVAPSAGQQIYIAGKTPTIQQLVLTNFGRYSAESIETQFDFITAIIQEWLSALGEENRQRIAADEILTQYVVQRIDDFVQQVNQNWDDKSQEIEDYIDSIMPSFTQTLREEIEAFAVDGMQDAIDQTLADSKTEIDEAVARANAAATAVAISGKVYDTPEAGVNPVTGVADGAYFNVRSPNAESYVDEYQNIGGGAIATGKRYLSALGVQQQEKPANTIKDESGKDQQEINNEWVSAERYGVRFNTTDDQSANLQRALNSGNNLLFPSSGTIYANNLTQSANGQILYSFGSVVIQKNANGPIINSSANWPQIHNIKFRGGSSNTPEFTGHNLVFTGSNPKFINSGSMWAAGRALKATGNAVVIRGSQDIWQTSDTTSTGYDIEIGTSGVCTLYHQLDGIYTSQKIGGILLVDTGSHSLKGGQIGKLTIKAGTKPSGVNGGMTMGCRILGDVNIEQSNAGFSNNQFSDITLTFGAGTSFCIVDSSNSYSSGFTSVNNGNGANNIVIQNNGTGADGFAYFKYGAGTSTRSLGMNFSDPTRGWKFDGSVILPNNHSLKMLDNTGIERIIAILAANNNLTIGANVGTYTYFQGTNLGLNSSGGTQVRVSDGFIAPFTDDAKTCGTAALRWSKSYTVDAHFFPLTSINPTVNGEMVFEKTSNTQLKIKVQGSDGVVRSATLTLA